MKKLFFNLLALLLINVIILTLAGMLIPTERYRELFIQKVEASTGRRLVIAGSLHLRFFPDVGVIAEKVTLYGPQDKKDAASFISVDSVKADMKLLPLLKHKIEVESLIFENPKVNLHVYADGSNNWEFKTEKAASSTEGGESTVSSLLPKAHAAFNVSNLSLRNATVSYIDELHDHNASAKELYLKVSLAGDVTDYRALVFTSHLHVGTIKYRDITFGETKGDSTFRNNIFKASLTNYQCYDGTCTANVTLNGNSLPLPVELEASFKNVQVLPLLRDTAEFDRLSGTGDLNVKLRTQWADQQTMLAGLVGEGRVMVTNGKVTHANFLDMFHNVQAAFIGYDKNSSTTFSQMGGTFIVENGVVKNQDLMVKMTGLTADGKGSIDLPNHMIHYRLNPELTTGKSAGAINTGVGIPVLIEGNLDNPTIKPEVTSVIQNIVTNPDSLKDQLKNGEKSLRGFLKGLGN